MERIVEPGPTRFSAAWLLLCRDLEIKQIGDKMKLLAADGFEKLITKKMNKSLDDFRPEITYRAILSIIDSPLCRVGQAKFIVRTKNGEIIDFKPNAKVGNPFPC